MITFKQVRDDNGNIIRMETPLRGTKVLRYGKLNKGTAFSAEERESLGLLGKIPFHRETLEEQVERYYKQYQENETDLQKNVYLNCLHDRNETAFYRLVGEHLKEMLPIVYTPTIGEAVETFSSELRMPRGLFIAYEDRDRIPEMLKNRMNPEVDLIVVTDGEGVLGIGDQGIGGMDISIGKLMVYTLCAGINPHRVLPIQLDVGTNNEKLLNDPMYVGWRHKRIEGKAYDDFIGKFVDAVRAEWPQIYLHWEDFGRENARKNLNRYRPDMLTFNDDMQGTGATALSCVLSGVQAAGLDLEKQNVVFLGAGTAGCGIGDQVAEAMMRLGLTKEQADQQIWMVDRNGLLVDDMTDMPDFQKPYAVSRDVVKGWDVADQNNITLLEVVKNAKTTILIGCSTVHGAFNEEICKAMAANTEHPFILPLSNPTSKSEADPKDVLNWTNGKAIVATGSPYDDVEVNGKKVRISQSNNSFMFPGLGLGVIAVKAKHMTDNMIWAGCQALRDCSPAKNDKTAPLLPDLSDVQKVAHHIAVAVAKQAIKDGDAEDCDVEQAIKNVQWKPEYVPIKYVSEMASAEVVISN